ncbi:hypothetical protein HNR16_002042 [Pseudoclavibacter chungangensis]|nr:DUF4233 domain-containing protein [Pseudoclavibacter chungangensis]NYJ67254.1 hypothetical protein [Pseudoclavibacter chungangensis]
MSETLGIIIMGFELLAVFLCVLVFFGTRVFPPPVALGGGAAVLAVMIVIIASLRYRWGIIAGWVFHILLFATGFLHAGMFVVGGLFLAAWAYFMIKAAPIDRHRAEVTAEYERALAAGEIAPDGTPLTRDASDVTPTPAAAGAAESTGVPETAGAPETAGDPATASDPATAGDPATTGDASAADGVSGTAPGDDRPWAARPSDRRHTADD